MRILFPLVLLLPVTAVAQSPEVPRAVIEQLSKDLAQLQRAVAEAQAQLQWPRAVAIGSPLTPMVTVIENTSLRAAAAENSATVFRVAKGRSLPVVSEVNGWYAVQAESPVQGTITGWLKPGSATPVSADPYLKTTTADGVFLTLTEHATRMKQTYQNNPYVSVSGFQVNVMPPGVSINFEFK